MGNGACAVVCISLKYKKREPKTASGFHLVNIVGSIFKYTAQRAILLQL